MGFADFGLLYFGCAAGATLAAGLYAKNRQRILKPWWKDTRVAAIVWGLVALLFWARFIDMAVRHR